MKTHTNTKPDQKKLAYSPVGMGLENTGGWGTFLLSTSRACNLGCDGCWTTLVPETIMTQVREGADWLCNGSYGVDVLDSLLRKFESEGGMLVACMSDGEPAVPQNYGFMLELARHCGNLNLPFLLFTNGVKMDEKKLGELENATKGKLSLCISMQTALAGRYGELMFKQNQDPGGREELGKTAFGQILQNLPALREYDKRTLERTGMHGVAVHTYIIPGITTEEDMAAIKEIAEKRLGGVPQVVSSEGSSVLDSLSGKDHAEHDGDELIEEYHTGPTATLDVGKGKQCAYISHGFYNLQKPEGSFGITFHPYYGGQVQTCPYHSEIGTKEWLRLRGYLDEVKKSGKPVTYDCVSEWLEASIKAMTMLTTAAFDAVGYEHCLTRHSKKPELDLFIAAVNAEMASLKAQGGYSTTDLGGMLQALHSSIEIVLARKGLADNKEWQAKYLTAISCCKEKPISQPSGKNQRTII